MVIAISRKDHETQIEGIHISLTMPIASQIPCLRGRCQVTYRLDLALGILTNSNLSNASRVTTNHGLTKQVNYPAEGSQKATIRPVKYCRITPGNKTQSVF